MPVRERAHALAALVVGTALLSLALVHLSASTASAGTSHAKKGRIRAAGKTLNAFGRAGVPRARISRAQASSDSPASTSSTTSSRPREHVTLARAAATRVGLPGALETTELRDGASSSSLSAARPHAVRPKLAGMRTRTAVDGSAKLNSTTRDVQPSDELGKRAVEKVQRLIALSRQMLAHGDDNIETGSRVGDDSSGNGMPASDPAMAKFPVQPAAFGASSADRTSSMLFEHFDVDNDGLLSEKEVAELLKQLTRKKREEDSKKAAAEAAHAPGVHDITIDGETLSVGDGDFDLLFKQLSNLKQTKDPSKDPRMTLQEDIVFVRDLVIVFCAATIGGVIASHFGQPALIGFLLGGMTVGPGGLGIVTELVEVETLASLGIAFLLFSLGIEFSLSELQDVRRVVLFGGLISLFAIVIGTGVLSLVLTLVKTVPEAVALGLAVSLSSTAVVLQCLPADPSASGNARHTKGDKPESGPPAPVNGENGVSSGSTCSLDATGATAAGEDAQILHPALDVPDALFAQRHSAPSAPRGFNSTHSRKVMLGLLVFQDVTIGLILALLPTLQGSVSQFVEEFLSAMLRLGCFVMLSLIIAEFLLPTLSDRLDRARSREVFTIGVVVYCLAMAYLSERMGLAIELGAFAAGIMLSESRFKHRVEESIEGIRSMFSAVFFISVGMMIHWHYFYQNFPKMLGLLFVILSTKTLVFAVVIYSLGGLSLRTAIACGAAIAQAGEFTFVVASKGQALFLFSAAEARMINGATALSMLASPYMIRYAQIWCTRISLPRVMNGSPQGDVEGV